MFEKIRHELTIESEHVFYIFLKGTKPRGYNPLQTVRCLPLLLHKADHSKESVGNYIISLETSDELAEIIELKRMNFFECQKRGFMISFALENENKTSY